MAILSKGNTYSSGDAVTAANLNSLVDSATFVSGSNQTTDDSTLEVHSSGYLKIKDGGVDTTQLAAGAVDSTKLDASFEITAGEIADNAVTLAKMEHGTAGDLLSYNTSAEPVRVSLGAASTYLRVNAAANAVEWTSVAPTSKYTAAWATSHGGTTVADSATITITHNLGTTDVVWTMYANSSASDTGASSIHGHDVFTSGRFGAVVTNLTSNTITFDLAQNGYSKGNGSGATTTQSFTGDYVKVVIIG